LYSIRHVEQMYNISALEVLRRCAI